MRRRMGTAARALAVERFSAEDIGRQTVEIYRSLLACRQVGKGES
jgi:glycosyltransferase involved in cell wall biosynthesis